MFHFFLRHWLAIASIPKVERAIDKQNYQPTYPRSGHSLTTIRTLLRDKRRLIDRTVIQLMPSINYATKFSVLESKQHVETIGEIQRWLHLS